LDLGAIEPRFVRLCHTLDRLARLHEDLGSVPPAVSGWQPPAGFASGAQALAQWLDAARDPEAAANLALLAALEAASKQLAAERRAGR
jgi:hypothetical protein